MPLNLDLSSVFLRIRLEWWVFVMNVTTGQVPARQYQGTHGIDVTYPWSRECGSRGLGGSVQFLHYKIMVALFLPSCSALLFGGSVHTQEGN